MIKPILSGRELDLLVAEKVMEHKIDSFGFERTNDYDGTDLKNYSTDISAAWEVVEKIENYFELTKIVIEPTKTKTIYTANILIGNNSFRGHSQSAPHAICLAALRATGIEI
jgi:hypothetical protein